MNTVIYDLSKQPTTYDFATFAVLAKSLGYDHVHFVADQGMAATKYSPSIGWRRFGNILIPLCALARLDYTVGGKLEGVSIEHKMGLINRIFDETGKIEKLCATYKLDELDYVTITMRDSFRNEWRNSNKEAWAKFKKHLESEGKRVIMLPECEHAPLDVEQRMALYCGATMNYGVNNGPMVLCLLSDAPYININFNPVNTTGRGYNMEKLLDWHGFPVGSQVHFKHDRQIIVYEPDTFENLVRAHEAMRLPERVAA